MCVTNVMSGFLKKTALAVTGFVFLATSATAAELPNFVPLVKKAGPAVAGQKSLPRAEPFLLRRDGPGPVSSWVRNQARSSLTALCHGSFCTDLVCVQEI